MVFDGGNSFDPDGAHRQLSLGLQRPRRAGRPTATVTRTYAAPGVYSARLTVTDDSGAINGVDQDELAIRINHQPVANAGHDLFTSEQHRRRSTASASADADGDALVYRWDFGDGSPPAGGVRATHTYAEGGTYPVVLTVDDGTGLRNAKAAIAAITVTIDRPPVADAGGNREACAGDVVVFDGSRSRDPEGGLLRYHWDFGDGTTADIVNPTKTYLRGAVYPVTLTVEDDSGFPGNRHTDRVLVRVNESPIAVAGPDQLACAGTEVALRRLGLARFRRRGQPLHLELRRRQHRRRRAAGARLRQARRLPGRADHRGRRDRPVRQHQLRRDDGEGGRGAGCASIVGAGQHRRSVRRRSFDASASTTASGPDRRLGLGLRRRRHGPGCHGRARLSPSPAPTSPR